MTITLTTVMCRCSHNMLQYTLIISTALCVYHESFAGLFTCSDVHLSVDVSCQRNYFVAITCRQVAEIDAARVTR